MLIKTQKAKKKTKKKTKNNAYNDVHKTLRPFDILPNVSFTTSEKSVIISNEHGMYELPQELPNDLRLKILGN